MTTAMKPQTSWPFPPADVALAEAAINPSAAELARQDGIQLLYHFDREDPRAGGYTIAYRPSYYAGRKTGKMVDVAVAYCSEGDVFSKKIGRDLAINNFREGMVIQVPALLYGDDYLHTCLRAMFSWDF